MQCGQFAATLLMPEAQPLISEWQSVCLCACVNFVRVRACLTQKVVLEYMRERDSEAIRICSPFSGTQRRMQMPFTFGFTSATLIGVNSPEGHGYSPGATQP